MMRSGMEQLHLVVMVRMSYCTVVPQPLYCLSAVQNDHSIIVFEM